MSLGQQDKSTGYITLYRKSVGAFQQITNPSVFGGFSIQQFGYKTAPKLLMLCILLFLQNQLIAQRYGTTVGARWGRSHFGVALQQRIKGNSTIEGMVLLNKTETVLATLYEHHKPLLFKWKGFNTYIGAGMHYGWYNSDTLKDQFWGFDGIMGIEYKILLLPIAMGLDFKPTYNFSYEGNNRQFQPQFAVSIRYVLVSYREQEKRKKQREKAQNKDKGEPNKILDIFKKKDNEDKDKKDKSQDKEKSEERKGLFDLFKKQDEDNNKDKNNNTKPKNDQSKEKKDSILDKINIFKKKDDQ